MRTPSGARKLIPALKTGMYQCVANYRCPKDTTRRLAGLPPEISFVVFQYHHEFKKIVYLNASHLGSVILYAVEPCIT